MNLKGCFWCQDCNERVNGSHFDRDTQTLEWLCSKGHTSFVVFPPPRGSGY